MVVVYIPERDGVGFCIVTLVVNPQRNMVQPVVAVVVAAQVNFSPFIEVHLNVRPVPGALKGLPLLDEQNVACYDEVPQNIRCDFTLRFSGDSMDKLNIGDGDIVYVRMMEDVRSHEVAVVVLEGALTLRRVYKSDTQIVLMAENPAYAPMVLRAGANVRILGKAVAFLDPNALGEQPEAH